MKKAVFWKAVWILIVILSIVSASGAPSATCGVCG